jgi:hypothetical protein
MTDTKRINMKNLTITGNAMHGPKVSKGATKAMVALAKAAEANANAIAEIAKALKVSDMSGTMIHVQSGQVAGGGMMDNAQIEKLLPCPFCGGEVRMSCDDYINGWIVMNPEYVIECDAPATQCPSHIRMADQNPDQLVAAWNRRDTAEVLRLTARIAQFEAVVTAGDGLAKAADDVVNDRRIMDAEFDDFLADTSAALDNYRAALAPFTEAKP